MMRKNLPVILGVCAFVALAIAMIAWRGGGARQEAPAVGGAFQMVDYDGRAVDQGLLKGRWSVVFFGFTYCPDICPTTLQILALAQDQLGPKGRDLQVVFVSVDPERDTPAALKAYLSSEAMPKSVVGLTGSPAQVATIAKAYHVFYEKAGEGPSYSINHSTAAYLMGPDGRFRRVIPYNLPPDEVARQVSDAMRAG
jgi:protein SCO1/2